MSYGLPIKGILVETDRGLILIYKVPPSPSAGPGFVKDEGKLQVYRLSYQSHRRGQPIKAKRQRPRSLLWGTFDTPAELWQAWLDPLAQLAKD